MAIINVPDGSLAKAVHVRQILSWLRGVPEFSEPVSFTGVRSASSYALTVANTYNVSDETDGDGLALAVKDSRGLRTLLEVKNAGVIVRPKADGTSIFKVLKNNGDTAFEVSSTGVSAGAETFITDVSVSTLTNKTLDGAIIKDSRVSTYLDVTRTTAPANPASTAIRLYSLTGGSPRLLFRDSSGNELTFIDDATSQTMTNKTLTTPTISSPDITGRVSIAQGSAPGTPSNAVFLYALTGGSDLRYKANSATERTLVDTDSSQTLSAKALTAPTMSSPVISDYAQLTQGSAPTGSAGNTKVYSRNSGSGLFFKAGSDTEREVVDLSTAQELTNKTLGSGTSFSGATLSAPYISNYMDVARLVATPGFSGITGQAKIRIWAKDDNNIYVNMPDGSVQTIFTNSNATTVAAVGFARAMALGGL